MIRISQTSSAYSVIGTDAQGEEVLSTPLHSLFLRGSLGGQPGAHRNDWMVPFGEDASIMLQRIIGHLARYQLQYELSEECVRTLRGLENCRRVYESLLRAGLAAKRPLGERKLASVRELLGHSFKRTLTTLQLQALNHLLNIHNGANFSVPGSGKTSVVLAYYCALRNSRQIDAMLVIGPGSCFEPWESESRACFKRPPEIVRLAGKPRAARHEMYQLATRNVVFVTTYQTAARDLAEMARLLRRYRYLLVLDESHYVKRPQGGMLADAVLKLAPCAERRVILTGTPMPNGLADLWTQITFLWYDQLPLGKVEDYLREIEDRGQQDALGQTRRALAPLFFRITKRQLSLPRPMFRTIKCNMSPLQARIYRGVAVRFLHQVREAPRDREALRDWRRARSVRLIQIASNPALLRSTCDEFRLPPMDLTDVALRDAIEHYYRYELPCKVQSACDIIRSITKSGQKVVVWSTFVHNLVMLAKQVEDLSPVVVHGGIPLASASSEEDDREELILRFKTDRKSLVLIANPAACAESISLHKICHNAVYLDRSFNCAHYLQSLDRIHRLGLGRRDRISYYLLIAEDSIDEVVHQRLREKMQNMRKVIDARFPCEVPGYWSEDLGDEEEYDFGVVEQHIHELVTRDVRKT